MRDIDLVISGMSCSHCLNAVNRALGTLVGVEVKSVRIGRAELKVTDPAAADRAKAAVEEAGYRVEAMGGV